MTPLPISLTRRGCCFTAAAVCGWASFLVIGLRDIWYLAALFTAFVTLAVCWVTFGALLARFAVALAASSTTPSAGETIALTATVTHRLPNLVATCFDWLLEASVVWRLGSESATQQLRAYAPGDGSARVLLWGVRRGRLTPAAEAILLADRLGLATWRIRQETQVELLVLPQLDRALGRKLQAAVSAPGLSHQATPHAQNHRSDSPSGAVRAYQVGDPIRQVHWKQSARQGELLVRLPENGEQAKFALYLVDLAEGYLNPDDFELAVKAAAAIGAEWIAQGLQCELHLSLGATLRCETEAQMLRALAQVQLAHAAVAAVPQVARSQHSYAGVVITGVIPRGLLEGIHQVGTLITVGATHPSLPENWRHIALHPEAPRVEAGPLLRLAEHE